MTTQPRGDGRQKKGLDQRGRWAWISSLEGPTRGSIWALGSGHSFLAAKERRTTQLVAHSQCPDNKHTCSSEKAKLSLALRSEGNFSHAVFNREPFIKSFLQSFLGSNVPTLGWLCQHRRCQVGPTLYIISSCLGNTLPLGDHHFKFCQKHIPSALLFLKYFNLHWLECDLLKHSLVLSNRDHRCICQL